MGMLCEWMLAESNREVLRVIFLDILQCGPEHETRQTFEITELFEFDRSVCGTTDVRRIGSRFAQRELRWRRRWSVKVKEERASAEGGEKYSEDDREREVNVHT